MLHGLADPPASKAPERADTDRIDAKAGAHGAHGSRRRRLWELSDESHCPVIGVCLPLAVLRKVVAKATVGPPVAGDYELHSCVVHECSRRNALTEALQRELDRRCASALRRFAAARDQTALAALWRDAVHQGDIAQALWAALTHPRCETALAIQVCRDVHMLQHQAGAMARADVAQLRECARRVEELDGELQRAQRGAALLQQQRAAEAAALGAQLMRVRGELIARDTQIAALRSEMAALRESMPDLDSRRKLAQRAAALAEQQRHLQNQNAELRAQLERSTRRADVPPGPQLCPQRDSDAAPAAAAPVELDQRAVLCVGGRSGNLAQYRDCIERHGGRFLHHDGGVENSARALDASLAAADLVICQAACISHNAYGLVKDHCKRTGKRCVFVERPSVAALTRGLSALARALPCRKRPDSHEACCLRTVAELAKESDPSPGHPYAAPLARRKACVTAAAPPRCRA